MNVNSKKQQLLENYLHAISLLLLENPLYIKKDVLERMVLFALKNYDGTFIEQWQLIKAMSIIREKDIKHKLIHRHVFEHGENIKNNFEVYDEESEDLAEKIISEFPHDTLLAQKLESMLFKWKLKNKNLETSKKDTWTESVVV